MRLRPSPFRRRPRRTIKSIQVLPTVVTMGNLLAGVLALAYLQDAAAATDTAARDSLWARAAWMVFLGMLCDTLDGRIARLTHSTSEFGAELDSLADVVTFGVVPAMIGKALLGAAFPDLSGRVLIALSVVYVLGAATRLARYNAESARTSAAGRGHVTLVFRGLPSPAAAGVVASLVLLWHEYQLHSLDWALLFAIPALGLLMVSRLPYPHLMNRLDGRRPIGSVVLLVVAIFLVVLFFLETIATAFFAYAISGGVLYALARWVGWPRWALHEEEDEAQDDAVVDDADVDDANVDDANDLPSAGEAPLEGLASDPSGREPDAGLDPEPPARSVGL